MRALFVVILKSQENLLVDSIYTQNADDFYLVENKSQFTYAFKILSERINNFHINNGVEILSPTSTYIEPFAGGAGIALDLLLNNVVDNIIINDYDKAIYSFWNGKI